MKRLTLFPKTFLASISMLAAMIVIAHGLIYLLMPAVYLQQKQQTAEAQVADLSRQLRGQSADTMRQTARSFALRHNVTITLTIDGRDETFQGFQAVNIIAEQPIDASLVTIAGEQIDPASIIIKTTTVRGSAGMVGAKLLTDVESVNQAKAATLRILPYTMTASLLVALVFSYCYSRFITRPIRRMAKVTTAMQQLQPGAHYIGKGRDEIAVLGNNVNRLYDNLRRTIQSLERENAHITRLEKEKLAFLHAASHELKTPLASLRIMLENMQLGVTPAAERERQLAESLATVDRLAAMVQDTLRASQTAEQAVARQKTLRVDQLVERVIDDYRLLASARRLAFAVDLAPLKVRANPDMLRRVLSNVISNAVRYSDRGSAISIRIQHDALSITNQCKPLSTHECARAFEPFYRLRQGRGEANEVGSGIGLYTVKLLLDARGWSYQFTPVKDGMRFTIDFSLEYQDAAERRATRTNKS
ncbi:sensor histidine kinase [Candidatus Southlakia epibionticum]|uniref:histidine kinase n=1 Tax=Candidatus Southlakia epibionticum TaxID=3043284 RepID=A0ABY8WWK2_9BACT|nr:HAMP domain-containing histidine kinase [Candidatus Saccharimonadaceae bacterium ML1]